MKDVKQNVFFEKLKIYVTRLKTNARKAYRQILGSPLLQKTAEKVKDLKFDAAFKTKIAPGFNVLKERIAFYTKTEPQTAAFVYVCLFCAFSIEFLDKTLALFFLKHSFFKIFRAVAAVNPSGWWFVILGALWLTATSRSRSPTIPKAWWPVRACTATSLPSMVASSGLPTARNWPTTPWMSAW